MKTWMSQKKKRHLAMLIAGTLSLTATLAVCPPLRGHAYCRCGNH
jgi:hypothetical protein